MKSNKNSQKPSVFLCEYLAQIKCSVFIGNVVDIYQREFLALRDRLHSAEQENLKRSKELNLVLDEIKRAIAEKQALRDINRTWSSLSGERQTLRVDGISSSPVHDFTLQDKSGLVHEGSFYCK